MLACPHCHRRVSVQLKAAAAHTASRSVTATEDNLLDLDDSPVYTFATQDTPLSYTHSEEETAQLLDTWKTQSGSASQTVEVRLMQLQKERRESKIDDTTSSNVATQKTTSGTFATVTSKHVEVPGTFSVGKVTFFKPLNYEIHTCGIRFAESVTTGTLKLTKIATSSNGQEPLQAEINLVNTAYVDLGPYQHFFTAQRDGYTHLLIESSASGILEVNQHKK